MAKTLVWSLVVIILLALVGAAAGYLTASHYQAPAQGGDARLRERAETYYRAIQVKDYQVVTGLYTPARQLAEADELRKTISQQRKLFNSFKPETRKTLRANSLTVKAADLDVQLEGDWAVTNGSVTDYPYPDKPDKSVQIPIGKVVWMRTGGDWWVYQQKTSELQAYGNPPDFALRVIKMQKQSSGGGIGSFEYQPLEGEQPPVAEGRGEAESGSAGGEGSTGGDALPDEVEDGSPPADNQDDGAGNE